MNRDKTAIVLDFLNGQLKELKQGDRLPSTRQIQEACGVSQAVVTRALDELQALNLIEAKPQSGYYKTDRKISTVHIVFLGKTERAIFEQTSFYYENLSRIIMGLSSKGFSVNFHVVNELDELPFYPLHSKKQQRLGRFPDSLIVTFRLRYSQLVQVALMEEHGFKFIHWLPDFIEPCPNSIRIDDKKLIRAQIELLCRKGHRRIAYIHRRDPEIWHRADNIRYEEFCHEVIEKQLQVSPEYLVYFNLYAHDQKYCDEQIEHLFSLKTPPTALLLTNDNIGKNVFLSLQKCSVFPGRDVAVLGTNNHTFCQFMMPELSSVGFDLDAGVNYLQNQASSSGHMAGDTWYLPLCIAERETT